MTKEMLSEFVASTEELADIVRRFLYFSGPCSVIIDAEEVKLCFTEDVGEVYPRLSWYSFPVEILLREDKVRAVNEHWDMLRAAGREY
jgi:hypothetical protein